MGERAFGFCVVFPCQRDAGIGAEEGEEVIVVDGEGGGCGLGALGAYCSLLGRGTLFAILRYLSRGIFFYCFLFLVGM